MVHPLPGVLSRAPAQQQQRFVDGMTLDFSRQSAGVLFAKAGASPTYYGVAKDELSPVETPAVVVMDIALRDRDYARLHTAQDSLRAGVAGPAWNMLYLALVIYSLQSCLANSLQSCLAMLQAFRQLLLDRCKPSLRFFAWGTRPC